MEGWSSNSITLRIFTVTELNEEIRCRLEQQGEVWVRGEISNLRVPSSGHSYFTLKDGESQIRVVIFRSYRRNIRFDLENGKEIVLLGRLSVYPPRGEYQIIGEYLEPMGVGALMLAFEELRRKLAAEGLFDPDRKLPMPTVLERIGVITSPTGAAFQDMLKIFRDREVNLQIVLYPVRVQGEGAEHEISTAIQELNRSSLELDIIILARGGGALEDLWAFNEEAVVRAISDSNVPIISAVGHEVDYTISDFAADLRVPTPTAAAHMVADQKEQFFRCLLQVRSDLADSVGRRIEIERNRIQTLSGRIQTPLPRIKERLQRLDDISERMSRTIGVLLRDRQEQIAGMSRLLESLSPLAVLRRGYSITTRNVTGEVLFQARDVHPGEELKIRLSEGSIVCEAKQSRDDQ